jgi:hypothetical protein
VEKKKTTLAFQFALQFFEKQLPADILRDATKKAKRDIDTVFPLNQVDPKRKDKRAELWKELDYLSPKDILQLRTALIVFAAFHVPFSALIKSAPPDYDENAANEEIVKLRDLLQNVNFLFGQTRQLLEKEIRYREVTVKLNRKSGRYDIDYSISGTIKLYRDFLKSTKEINLNGTQYRSIAAFLSTLQDELRFNIKKGRNLSDLPLRTLIFIVFLILWRASKKKKASARLTAQLMTEYFSYNNLYRQYYLCPYFQSCSSKVSGCTVICEEMTEEGVLNQWKNSTYNGELLRSKSPWDILK